MSLESGLATVFGPKYRRDIAIILLAIFFTWEFSIFNGRVSAAEAKASSLTELQKDVQDVKVKQAKMEQQVADTSANVNQLVAVILGRSAVISNGKTGKQRTEENGQRN